MSTASRTCNVQEYVREADTDKPHSRENIRKRGRLIRKAVQSTLALAALGVAVVCNHLRQVSNIHRVCEEKRSACAQVLSAGQNARSPEEVLHAVLADLNKDTRMKEMGDRGWWKFPFGDFDMTREGGGKRSTRCGGLVQEFAARCAEEGGLKEKVYFVVEKSRGHYGALVGTEEGGERAAQWWILKGSPPSLSVESTTDPMEAMRAQHNDALLGPFEL